MGFSFKTIPETEDLTSNVITYEMTTTVGLFLPYDPLKGDFNTVKINVISKLNRLLTQLLSVTLPYAPKCYYRYMCTVKILKFGTPQTIAIIVLKIEKFDVTLH